MCILKSSTYLDPFDWNDEDIASWLNWTARKLETGFVNPDQLPADGKKLCLLSR